VQVLLKVIDGMTIDIALQVRVEEVFFFAPSTWKILKNTKKISL